MLFVSSWINEGYLNEFRGDFMGVFNYKSYSFAHVAELVSSSYNLAIYSNTGKVLGLGSFLASRLFAKHPDRINYSTDVLNEG